MSALEAVAGDFNLIVKGSPYYGGTSDYKHIKITLTDHPCQNEVISP